MENAVYNDPRVLECAAVAVPDAKLGELVAVLVIAKDEFRRKLKEAELIEEAKKQ